MLGKDFENPWGRTTRKGKPLMMSSIMNSAVFPGMQGGPLEHVIAGKAVAFAEALTDEFSKYGQLVIRNAQIMTNGLVDLGYQVVSGGTDNHLMLIDLRNKDVTGKAAEQALVRADLTINKNMVPYDDKSPFVTSGIRIGTAAISTRGLQDDACLQLVEWIDAIISDHENEAKIKSIKKEVNSLMKNYPLYPTVVIS